MRDLLREARAREGKMVRLLGRFVRCESPSGDKAAVDRFGAMVAREWRRRGAKVKILEQRLRGNHLRIEMAAAAKSDLGAILRVVTEKARIATTDRFLCLGIWIRFIRLGRLRRCRFA